MDTYHLLLYIQYASIAVMFFMSAIIAKRWTKTLHAWLFFYCISTLVNNAGYLAVMLATNEQAAVLSWQISYLGRVWIPYSLLQFAILLCRKKRHRWISDCLAVLHVATYCLVLFMQHNTLYYTSYSFVEEGLYPHIEHTNGIWHYGFAVLIFGYMVYGFLNLFLQLRKEKTPRRRKQLIFIIVAIIVDCVFYFLQMFHPVPGYDVTTLGYTLATIPLYFAIFRYDMFGAKELARDLVIDRVQEGIIVTDEGGEVVDFNQKAKAILPDLSTKPGAAVEQVRALIAENQTLDVGDKKYTPKENPLMDEKHAAGFVYMLSDDTEHYRHAEQLTKEMMHALSKTVDAKDHYTNGHSERVAKYSKELARRMGMSAEEQETIYEMGLLHDIGKIGVSEEIINKTSRLTDEEFARIKEHTVVGCEILRQITVMPELADGARSHHERYDGRGYPDGLRGEEIPLAARIICLADCYDAMTSTRTYSKPKEQAAVRDEIIRCSGSQFDPEIAKVMVSMIDDDKEYTMHE